MVQVRGVGPRVGGRLSLFCIHRVNQVYSALVVTLWTCYSALLSYHYYYLVRAEASNALVTLVAVKEDYIIYYCFHEPFLKLSKLSEFLSSSGNKLQTVGPALWNARQPYVLSRQRVRGKGRVYIGQAVNGRIPWHSCGVSLAIWDHTVLPATRYK